MGAGEEQWSKDWIPPVGENKEEPTGELANARKNQDSENTGIEPEADSPNAADNPDLGRESGAEIAESGNPYSHTTASQNPIRFLIPSLAILLVISLGGIVWAAPSMFGENPQNPKPSQSAAPIDPEPTNPAQPGLEVHNAPDMSTSLLHGDKAIWTLESLNSETIAYQNSDLVITTPVASANTSYAQFSAYSLETGEELWKSSSRNTGTTPTCLAEQFQNHAVCANATGELPYLISLETGAKIKLTQSPSKYVAEFFVGGEALYLVTSESEEPGNATITQYTSPTTQTWSVEYLANAGDRNDGTAYNSRPAGVFGDLVAPSFGRAVFSAADGTFLGGPGSACLEPYAAGKNIVVCRTPAENKAVSQLASVVSASGQQVRIYSTSYDVPIFAEPSASDPHLLVLLDSERLTVTGFILESLRPSWAITVSSPSVQVLCRGGECIIADGRAQFALVQTSQQWQRQISAEGAQDVRLEDFGTIAENILWVAVAEGDERRRFFLDVGSGAARETQYSFHPSSFLAGETTAAYAPDRETPEKSVVTAIEASRNISLKPPAGFRTCMSTLSTLAYAQFTGGEVLVCGGDSGFSATLVLDGMKQNVQVLTYDEAGWELIGAEFSVLVYTWGGLVTVWETNGNQASYHLAATGDYRFGTSQFEPTVIDGCPSADTLASYSIWEDGWMLTCGDGERLVSAIWSLDWRSGVSSATVEDVSLGHCAYGDGLKLCSYSAPAVVVVSSGCPAGATCPSTTEADVQRQFSVKYNMFVNQGMGGTGQGTGDYNVPTPQETVKSQLFYLAQILLKSAAARSALEPAIEGCGDSLELARIVANREELLRALERTPVTQVPNGLELVAELETALEYSLEADRALLAWAESDSCDVADAKAEAVNKKATKHKEKFASMWNDQIARKYGLIEFSADDI
ncbi:MAG: hypothetical protein LBR21_03430 [Propionibacteriaceae bacterium]|jgi:hypothetical protein|nr:hypothetical protein [Propionibacteriaceae bacterium]